MTMSRQSELDRYLRAVPHRPALPARLEKLVAFLWLIAPIWPVLPTSPAYKSFAVYKTPAARRLRPVEVAGSNPALPSEESHHARRDHEDEPKAIFQAQPFHGQFQVALFRQIRPPYRLLLKSWLLSAE